jgi:photosystem II stability/assembly factor-like uncharacterized protein
MKPIYFKAFLLFVAISISGTGFSKKKVTDNPKEEKTSYSQLLKGVKFRNIGPAFMSGRIADIAVNPNNQNEWYVAVGSGGVFKTSNAGTTWKAIFEKQQVYSTGCITIDPSNENRIWLGTGENVGGRHVSFGDGVYLSEDAGKSWKNMGLKTSEHISKIIVHPENSEIVWVAAQGPLWNKGGERGLYKTTDGGKTWKQTLKIDEWTGVTDVIIDPRNPNVLYAASWQRHRNVAAYMGGGPGTALYKSTDGGESWRKIENGIPKKDKGKIGLAISPQNPDVLYAAIEFERRKGAVYRSSNKGESWVKMSETVSGATGPHYYQELYADPNQFDRIILVDVRMQYSNDGGKTFSQVKEEFKHSDNHAIVFRKGDPNYMLVGTDGGVYETFDKTESWRFVNNLPVTQFYKLALDDTKPFYNIYGGTQDNSTQMGPSRTLNASGIQNRDWQVVLGGDGHQPATEPGNPNIAYAESQVGYLFRLDRKTGERVFIQPQPGTGEMAERYNWDAPILVSPHKASRIYFASQHLWKSDNRGDSWTRISPDLTRNQNRLKLPIMEQKWSWDAAWDLYAMSNYNTITSISESPQKEGQICVGTDDGRLQLTEDGGENWKEIPVNQLSDCPATAFVNDIKFDLFDANTLYVALDNHKFGDFNPYLYKSTDLGASWKRMTTGLDSATMVWRVVQDHINPQLMFAGTEFGLFVSFDGGEKWEELNGGMPTIGIRDLAIHKEENDLVAASFGRGFFILDDYSFLRDLSSKIPEEDVKLFEPRDGLWYFEQNPLGYGKRGSQGASLYSADNPPFGVTFTYYLKDSYKSLAEKRKEEEAKKKKDKESLEFPDWNVLDDELNELKPALYLMVLDKDNLIVRKKELKQNKGFNRISWDLKTESKFPIDKADKWRLKSTGMMVPPGSYRAVLIEEKDGGINIKSDTVEFSVNQLMTGSLSGTSIEEVAVFWKELEAANAEVLLFKHELSKSKDLLNKLKVAYKKSGIIDESITSKLFEYQRYYQEIDTKLNNPKAIQELQIDFKPTISSRLSAVWSGVASSSYGPTPMHREQLEIAIDEMNELKPKLESLKIKLKNLKQVLLNAGAPVVID